MPIEGGSDLDPAPLHHHEAQRVAERITLVTMMIQEIARKSMIPVSHRDRLTETGVDLLEEPPRDRVDRDAWRDSVKAQQQRVGFVDDDIGRDQWDRESEALEEEVRRPVILVVLCQTGIESPASTKIIRRCRALETGACSTRRQSLQN
jgi:hypothetical protein